MAFLEPCDFFLRYQINATKAIPITASGTTVPIATSAPMEKPGVFVADGAADDEEADVEEADADPDDVVEDEAVGAKGRKLSKLKPPLPEAEDPPV